MRFFLNIFNKKLYISENQSYAILDLFIFRNVFCNIVICLVTYNNVGYNPEIFFASIEKSDKSNFIYSTDISFSNFRRTPLLYPFKIVAVFIMCPEFYGKDFFKVGDTYAVTLFENSITTENMPIGNADILKKYDAKEIFRSMHIRKLK